MSFPFKLSFFSKKNLPFCTFIRKRLSKPEHSSGNYLWAINESLAQRSAFRKENLRITSREMEIFFRVTFLLVLDFRSSVRFAISNSFAIYFYMRSLLMVTAERERERRKKRRLCPGEKRRMWSARRGRKRNWMSSENKSFWALGKFIFHRIFLITKKCFHTHGNIIIILLLMRSLPSRSGTEKLNENCDNDTTH